MWRMRRLRRGRRAVCSVLALVFHRNPCLYSTPVGLPEITEAGNLVVLSLIPRFPMKKRSNYGCAGLKALNKKLRPHCVPIASGYRQYIVQRTK